MTSESYVTSVSWIINPSVLIPFLLNSLGRYTFSLEYALSARYVFFTLFGTLLVVGTTLTIVCRKIAVGPRLRLLPAVVMVIMIFGQILSTPLWQKDYLNLSQTAFECYKNPKRFIEEGPFIINPYHPIGPKQVHDIKWFFQKEVWL